MAENTDSPKKKEKRKPAEVDPAIGTPASDSRVTVETIGDENLSLMIKEACRLERKYGASHERSIDAVMQVAHACEDVEYFIVAKQLHGQVLHTLVAVGDEGKEIHASTLSNLGETCRKLKLYDEAETYLSKSLEITEKINGPHHPHTAFTLNSMVGLYTDQGKYEKAEPLSKRSLDIFSGELLAQVIIKDLDSGTEAPLSSAEHFLPKGVNPIELHSIEEILATCMVKNLDTGTAGTLEKIDSVAPKVEDPLSMRNYEDVLATMVIKNLDTGQATTLDTASGNFVPSDFAPATERSITGNNNNAVAQSRVPDKKGWTGNKLKQLLRKASTTSVLRRTSSTGSRVSTLQRTPSNGSHSSRVSRVSTLQRTPSNGSHSSRSSRSSRSSNDRVPTTSPTSSPSGTPTKQLNPTHQKQKRLSGPSPLVDPKKVAQYKAPKTEHVPEVFEGD